MRLVDGNPLLADPPAPPPRLLQETRRLWDEFWGSSVAAAVDVSDVPAIRRLFMLRDQWERMRRAVDKTPLVSGSQGQPVENPLAKRMDRIATQIVQLEDRFGLSPVARAKLGVETVAARRGLEELIAGWDDDPDDDPRVVDVD